MKSHVVYTSLATVFPGCYEASGQYTNEGNIFPHVTLMVALIATCPMNKGMQHVYESMKAKDCPTFVRQSFIHYAKNEN